MKAHAFVSVPVMSALGFGVHVRARDCGSLPYPEGRRIGF